MGAPLVLDPRRLARIDEAAGDGDELAGKEVQISFPIGTVHRQGAVAPHAAARVNGQRLAQLLLVEAVDGPGRGFVHALRALAEQPAMRRAVVVLIDEGPEPHVEIMQRAERARVIETPLAQRPPKNAPSSRVPERRRAWHG